MVTAVNASYLGKNGAVSHLFRLLAVSNRKFVTLSKYALDSLVQLVKSSKFFIFILISAIHFSQ
jgi:hypothetical protein